MKICVIGLGYIGLPTAAMFANAGHQVIGVDKKADVVEALNKGEILIEEVGLADFIKKPVSTGNLVAKTEVEEADAFIVSVPTPITAEKKADMRFVKSATEDIVPVLKEGNLVILESTSPVGTVDTLMKPILDKAGVNYLLGHSPERVIPGQILYELVHNSRVAGGYTKEAAHAIAELYKSFVEGEIYETDARTAEMAKLSENTFRDVNIAFANELAKICEQQGINVWELINICNKHPRVNIHQPGPGVGGHCIAVDPWFIVEKEPSLAQIINLSRHTNDGMPQYVADRAEKILGSLSGKIITILGTTYKPDVDDMRESPIIYLADILLNAGAIVKIHDPYVAEKDLDVACAGADLIILGVNHKEYKDLDFEKLAGFVRQKNFFDTRNFCSKDAAEKAGFRYELLGK